MGKTVALECRGITKTFGRVMANRDCNLQVYQGEILAILGENGSGKTTLMNMVAGIYFPDKGQIFVGGEEATIASPKDAFTYGIGMIHQHFKLVDVLTAAENIILGLPGKLRLDMKAVKADIQKLHGIACCRIADPQTAAAVAVEFHAFFPKIHVSSAPFPQRIHF